jgi:hypothetical protein
MAICRKMDAEFSFKGIVLKVTVILRIRKYFFGSGYGLGINFGTGSGLESA